MDIDGKKLRVGFQDLTIEIKDADFRTDNLTDCYGHYLQRENKIQINTNLEPHDLLNTVIHECLHACAYVGGLTTKSNPLSDEDKVESHYQKLKIRRSNMDIMKKYKQGDLDEVPSAKTANDPMNLPADEKGGENVDAPKIKQNMVDGKIFSLADERDY
jgi:hypothetical protein